jgi:hypothetical protein
MIVGLVSSSRRCPLVVSLIVTLLLNVEEKLPPEMCFFL